MFRKSDISEYTYTGQYSHTADFGLMFYIARWYDPSLGRFASADSIVPEQSQEVQAWDRYAYTNNNPVRYNDPSGRSIDPPWLRGDASNFWDLLFCGLFCELRGRYSSAIVGDGLLQIRADADVVLKKQEIIDFIQDRQSYRQKAFLPVDRTEHVDLAEHGSLWKDMQDPTFWMVNEGDLTAKHMEVAQNGTIHVTWEVSDTFDYRPHWKTFGKRSWWVYFFYNGTSAAIEAIYHKAMGASDIETTATWEETIYPDEESLQYQRGR